MYMREERKEGKYPRNDKRAIKNLGTEESTGDKKYDKVLLDSINKLQHMSFKEISELEIHKCYGEIFDLALEQAIKMEKIEARTLNPIPHVEFCVNYKTQFGNQIGILGNTYEFGGWDPSRIVRMKWTEGHYWRALLNSKDLGSEIEYKFVIYDSSGVIHWEGGDNHYFSFKKVLDHFSKPEFAYTIASSPEFVFRFQDEKYIYKKHSQTLIIILNWKS